LFSDVAEANVILIHK